MTCKKKAFVFDGDIGNVARRWPNVEDGRADRQNVVDLARVNDADKAFTHDDDVQISRGKRMRELV